MAPLQISKTLPTTAAATTRMQFDPNSNSFPLRKDLPAIPGAPKGAAWFWGADDQLGRVNLLTPARVKEAVKEVVTGEMVPLNLEVSELKPCYGRETFEHTIKNIIPRVAFDDLYSMNTQSSTQWDGLRHFAHLDSEMFYNGCTQQDIIGPDANSKCGMQAWSQHGIVGRAILIDYVGYAEANNLPALDYYDNQTIPLSALIAAGKMQGIDVRPAAQGGDVRVGDILLIRSGFIKNYRSLSPEDRVRLHSKKAGFSDEDEQAYPGLEQTEEVLDWLHDCYFAAMAGDAPAFEAWPNKGDFCLHEYILALWGCPLGELWDLEQLAAKCRKSGKWTFLLTSSPANVNGGVGSHANAIAIL